MRVCDAIVLGSTLLTVTQAYKAFMKLIPNGDRIPHPCGSVQFWRGGIGHFVPAGGGPNNEFGLDFKKYSMKWSHELCITDSDGDGRTNGDELGDPGCKWSPGSIPERRTNLSHPGICEPIDSEACRERNSLFVDALNCNQPTTTCSAKMEAGMKKMDIRFPQISIPSLETNYFCMIFDLPVDEDYHLVATDPIINKSGIVHLMLLFGCDEPPNSGPQYAGRLSQMKEEPYRCGMVASPWCRQIIGTWKIGSHGDCFSREAGFRIGRNGYRTVALQVHWNNPLMLADQSDSSGMTIYYTANRRYHDAAFLMVGQQYLRIPPHAPSVSYSATCPSACTEEMFQEKIYVTRAVNHMHYLGTSQSVSLYRDGKKIIDFTKDDHYQYDNPKIYNYDTPIEVLPGDEIRTKCTYSSNRNETVYFGAGTDDAMCFGFLTYYPTHNMSVNRCTSWKTVQSCHIYLPKFKGIIDNCDYWKFVNSSNTDTTKLITNINKQCTKFNKDDSESCSSECGQQIKNALKHECLQNDIGGYMLYGMALGELGSEVAAYNLLYYNGVCGTNTNGGSFNAPTIYFLCLTLVFLIAR